MDVEPDRCPACGRELEADERAKPACEACDRNLDLELSLWIAFVEACAVGAPTPREVAD